MTTVQDEAITVLNTMIVETQRLLATKQRLDALSAQWTNLSVANKVNAFATAPLLTTGQLGTADGSPNTANPVDTRVTPTVMFPISANNFAGIMTYLTGISAAIGGTAVGANGAAPQLLAITQ